MRFVLAMTQTARLSIVAPLLVCLLLPMTTESQGADQPIVFNGSGTIIFVADDGKNHVLACNQEGRTYAWNFDTGGDPIVDIEIGKAVLSAHFCHETGTLYVASMSKLKSSQFPFEKWKTELESELVVSDVSLSDDGELMIVGLGKRNYSGVPNIGEVRIIDLKSGKLLYRETLDEAVRQVAASPDGSLFSYWAEKEHIKVLDIAGEMVAEIETQGNDLCFSPNGRFLAITDDTVQPIKIWDWETRKIVNSLELESEGEINYLTNFSADGEFLVRGYQYAQFLTYRGLGGVSIHRTKDLEKLANFSDLDIPSFKRRHNAVLSVAFSQDGSSVLSGNGAGRVKRWDLSAIRKVKSPNTED